MINIENLTKKFGTNISLDNVSCDFNKNDSVALMGANGAGKTTLIRSILGYYHPNSGKVLIDGLDPIKDRIKVLKNISFVPQLPPPIKLSIEELMQYISISADVDKELIKHYSDEMKLDISANLNKSFFKLSGGMKQKLLIAISLAKKSSIIIYDEPTANLDPKARDDFYRLLKQNEDEKILLFVTHRLEEVKNLVNRQIYMDMGKIVSDEKF
ncbi:MAG: ABC transporter ATP-binding protein [Sulfurimonas sp. RIFCSPHIGHO2_12_FULL_36_9]|jgi:ABC-2 type transport system ATP-binding protein|uniref:ABC transporter ATP-binding protein n=1 Tax=unclassified Sulfurimonas TaxID=2623549 RepID=UPI0008BC3BA6|nr:MULTISPECIES: ABC transporter ATP-binding protein [unclassified Sulfurimonas]OHD97301.1 MAG: ABC transporter ATP-binding protein [Sulfurimonas sp. RIFCSPLOWO2_02_FULL_36_28]OHD99280.1 MAG: ABC transporter ATP-binding protein [Sulfurimonas sp. RIFCSPHIGHO2_12_FULL_36_9]OHE01242.1 MAG: ABC transporter ATP-binding protein [Sulfurimonas sp. RIFCSPLOWO2_12_FULL_36_74]OHE01493.1 MAG: ABC transporter ATP-binding protein [Sulfurimonas sp. RIFCSPLOWO2_12_36_12]